MEMCIINPRMHSVCVCVWLGGLVLGAGEAQLTWACWGKEKHLGELCGRGMSPRSKQMTRREKIAGKVLLQW